MAGFTGDYSRNVLNDPIHSEEKRFLSVLYQQGKSVIDADLTSISLLQYLNLRRVIQNSLGDGSTGDAFKCVERIVASVLAENDFNLIGGYTPEKGPEIFFLGGHPAKLFDSVNAWKTNKNLSGNTSGILATTITDSSAFWITNEFVGRKVVPDINQPTKVYDVVANTQTTITVTPGSNLPVDGIVSGKPYKILLTTPTADRQDVVILDIYAEEIDGTEDADILHATPTLKESARRLKLIQNVYVREGTTDLPTSLQQPDGSWIDSDGNEHFLVKLAVLSRLEDDATISNAMMEDLRPKIFKLVDVDDRFVNALGDTMSGNLIFSSGSIIQGTDVVAGLQIKSESIEKRHFLRTDHLLGDGDVVPSGSNLPVVHDNRYFTQSIIASNFSENILTNGNLVSGLDGWENRTPVLLWGGPTEEVFEKARMYWSACGIKGCARSLVVDLTPEYAGCDAFIMSQDVDIDGGGFFAFQMTCQVSEGSEDLIVKPFLRVHEYVSGQLVGKRNLNFKEYVDNEGIPLLQNVLISKSTVATKLTVFFEINPNVDSLKIIPSFETIFPCCSIEEKAKIYFCDFVFKKFATDGQISNDERYLLPGFSGHALDQGLFNAGVAKSPVAAKSDILLGKAKQTPTIESIGNEGLVTYTKGYKQSDLLVYRRDPDVDKAANGALFLWKKTSPGVPTNPSIIESVALKSISWLKTAIGLASDEMDIISLDVTVFDLNSGSVTVTFRGRNIPPAVGLSIVANPTTDISIGSITVDDTGLFGTFDIIVGAGASVGVNTIRFTRTSDGNFEDKVIEIKEALEPAPLIYHVSDNVISGVSPLAITIKGKNFISGQTSVAATNSNISVVVGTVSANSIDITVTKGAGLNPPPSTPVTINVSTPFGFDSFTLWVVQNKISQTLTGAQPIQVVGEAFPSAAGFSGSVTEVFLTFESLRTKLNVVGGGLQNVTQIHLYYARIDGRSRGTQGGFKITLISSFDTILQSSFEQIFSTGIKVDIKSLIDGTGNNAVLPFAIRVVDSGGESATFLIEQREAITLTNAYFRETGYGPQLLGGVFEVEGTNLHGGVGMGVQREVDGVGVLLLNYSPPVVGSPTNIFFPVEQPTNEAEAMNVYLFCAPFGMGVVTQGSFNLVKAGSSNVNNGVTASQLASFEAETIFVSSIVETDIEQGQTKSVSIIGTGFKANATVTIDPGGEFVVSSVVVNSEGTLITCSVQASGVATLGTHDLTVTNPDSTNSTLVDALTVVIPEAQISVVLDGADGNPASSMKIVLDPAVDIATVIEGIPASFVGGRDFAPLLANSGDIRFDIKPENTVDSEVIVVLVDNQGNKASKSIGLTSALTTGVYNQVIIALADLERSVFNFLNVVAIQFSFIPAVSVSQSDINIDNIQGTSGISPGLNFTIDDFSTYADTDALLLKWSDAGANHAISVGSPISREIIPLVNMPSDESHNIVFYGDVGWELADIVLVPFTDENIAAEEFDWLDFGVPGEGVRKVIIENVTYKTAPQRCCRNIFIETMHIEKSTCKAVEATERDYTLPNPGCDCAPPSESTQKVGGPVSDPLLYRFLPDDGFNAMPENHGESFTLRYCQNVNGSFVTECGWVELGSKSTPGQIFYAGGGRNDPTIPASTPENPETGRDIFVTVYLGPGSPHGARESLLSLNAIIEEGALQVQLNYSSLGNDGFAVGQEVWLFNLKDPRSGGQVRFTPYEMLNNPSDPRLSGIYGTISSIDSDDHQLIVDLFDPAPANCEFRVAWGATVMVSPRDRMGFYWEASRGLVEMVSGSAGIVCQWWFQMWNAPEQGLFDGVELSTNLEASIFLADGDGTKTHYKMSRPTGKILKERDWFDMFSSPVRPLFLLSDSNVGATFYSVCYAAHFDEGDIIVIQDNTFLPGFRTSVISVDNVLNRVFLKDPIPDSLPGYGSFDGFKINRSAKVYKVVTRANKMACITDNRNEDNTPADGVGYVTVNFESGLFTFDEDDSGRARILYSPDQKSYQLPAVEGTYSMRSVNVAGKHSEWSQNIYVNTTP